ncbi:MAG TPA: rod shape-determining protein [Candidatus Dormibacteraeota bacterium]|nr:rod shape-determining protein [Candidatus Dormibacteraeota bacterium]
MALRRFGIDLSPDQVEVWARGEGLVIQEPAVLARQRGNGRPLAFGVAALEMAADRDQEVELSWPLGVERLGDTGAAEQFLRQVIFRVVGRLLFSRHELMLGVPAELSTKSRRALLQVAMASGARMAHMMDLPVAAALGAGLPIAAWTPLPLLFLLPQAAQLAIVCHEGLLSHRAIAPLPGSWDGEMGLAALSQAILDLLLELPGPVRAGAEASGLALAGRGLTLAPIGDRLAASTGLAARILPDPDHCVAKGTEVALARIESLGAEGLLYLR